MKSVIIIETINILMLYIILIDGMLSDDIPHFYGNKIIIQNIYYNI